MKYKLYQHISKWIKHITKMMKYIPSRELHDYYCTTNDEQLIQSYVSFKRGMARVVELMELHVFKRDRMVTRIDGCRSRNTEYYFIANP